MMSFNVQRIFILAIKNEVLADKNSAKNYGSLSPLNILVPRGFIFRHYSKKFFPIVDIFTVIFFIIWPITGVFYILWQFLKSLVTRRSRGVKVSGNVLLSAGPLSRANARRLPARLALDYEIVFPDYTQTDNEVRVRSFSLPELATFRDRLFAAVQALKAHFSAPIRLRPSQWLYSFWSFRWFLCWSIFNRSLVNCDNIIFCNHYDRWAVLFDALDIAAKRIMLQHGTLPKHLDFPYKMRNCSKFFLLWREDETYVKHHIISECSTGTKFLHVPKKLFIEDTPEPEHSILVVLSMPPYQKIQNIVDLLSDQLEGIFFYIKPHPSYAQSHNSIKHARSIEIWEGPSIPNCSVVLSGPSTLGKECEDAGLKVVYYDEEPVETVVAKTISLMNR